MWATEVRCLSAGLGLAGGQRPRRFVHSVAGETEAGRGGTRPRSLGAGQGRARGIGAGPARVLSVQGRCLCVLAPPPRHRGPASPLGRQAETPRGWDGVGGSRPGAELDGSLASGRCVAGLAEACGRAPPREPAPPRRTCTQVPEALDSVHAPSHPLTRPGRRGEFRARGGSVCGVWAFVLTVSLPIDVHGLPLFCFCATFWSLSSAVLHST